MQRQQPGQPPVDAQQPINQPLINVIDKSYDTPLSTAPAAGKTSGGGRGGHGRVSYKGGTKCTSWFNIHSYLASLSL